MIDTILRTGSNQERSQLRIIYDYMADPGRSIEDHISFLKKEYREGGKGIVIGGKEYSVWFDELGFRVAEGHTVKDNLMNKVFLSWEDVAGRIGELLRQGEYAPQAVLDAARDNAMLEHARVLAYMERDLADGVSEIVFEDSSIFRGGFQDVEKNVASRLADPAFLEDLCDRLEGLALAYKENPEVMRFNFYKPDLVAAQFRKLRQDAVPYAAREGFTWETDLSTFITQDEMGVTINMDKHYKIYLGGKSVDEIADLVQQQAADAFERRPDVDMSRLKDYESLCSNVMMEAVSREKNAEYLQNIPHFDMADLSIIYRLNVGRDRNHDIGVVTVDNQLLSSMGVSQDQFQKDVFEQAIAGEPPILKSLAEVMDMNFMGDDSEPEGGLFLATNRDALYGASVIAIPGFLDLAADKLGGSFYILPSSVHEVLLLRNDEEVDVREMESMVQEINAAIVSPEEQLSDRVYHYDSQDKVFELASDYEQRIAEKEKGELEAVPLDKGIGAWSVRGQGIDFMQEEDSGRLQDKHSVPETGKEGHAVSDEHTAVKPARSERKSVLGALQEKKEQVRAVDGGRQEQQKAQNRPHTRNDVSI